jgi:protein ImuB
LVRLRLENIPLKSGVIEIQLDGQTVSATAKQLQLFVRRRHRDLEAADRALARLRAQFGPEAVVHIKIHPGHLPEARFSFEPVAHTTLPRDMGPRRPTLARRIFTPPLPLRAGPALWEGHHFQQGDTSPFMHRHGPYILSGGWWHREICREYYFGHTQKGDILWIYYDRKREQWFIHGTVE